MRHARAWCRPLAAMAFCLVLASCGVPYQPAVLELRPGNGPSRDVQARIAEVFLSFLPRLERRSQEPLRLTSAWIQRPGTSAPVRHRGHLWLRPGAEGGSFVVEVVVEVQSLLVPALAAAPRWEPAGTDAALEERILEAVARTLATASAGGP